MKTAPRTINERKNAHRRSLDELCGEAVDRLEQALQASPQDVTDEADVAGRALVRLRDRLIERLRREGASADAPQLRAGLDRVNAILSLVVGVDNPRGSFQKDMLKQARDALRKLRDEGFPLEQRDE